MPANGTAGTEVVPYEGALLQPAAPLPDIARRFGEYSELCAMLLEDDDWQTVGVPRPFLKRSGWRKLATAMGVTLEKRAEHVGQDGEGKWWARVEYRATAPNGRFADALGACHQSERKFTHPMHDVIATADTRSKSRACSDLFGLGQLSAEEVGEGGDSGEVAPPSPTRQHPPPAPGDVKSFRARVRELAERQGWEPDALRHLIVRNATQGRTESSADLTRADLVECWSQYRRALGEMEGAVVGQGDAPAENDDGRPQ